MLQAFGAGELDLLDALDARMQCLDQRLNEFTSFVSLLSGDVDRGLLNKAIDATMSLESAESCARLEYGSMGRVV